MKACLSFLLIGIILFSACKKEDADKHPIKICNDLTIDYNSVQNLIFGNWELIEIKQQSRGGFSYYSPSDAGYTEVLKIEPNSAQIFRNNKLDTTFISSIEKRSLITNNISDSSAILVYYNGPGSSVYTYFIVEACAQNLVLHTTQYSAESALIYRRK